MKGSWRFLEYLHTTSVMMKYSKRSWLNEAGNRIHATASRITSKTPSGHMRTAYVNRTFSEMIIIIWNQVKRVRCKNNNLHFSREWKGPHSLLLLFCAVCRILCTQSVLKTVYRFCRRTIPTKSKDFQWKKIICINCWSTLCSGAGECSRVPNRRIFMNENVAQHKYHCECVLWICNGLNDSKEPGCTTLVTF